MRALCLSVALSTLVLAGCESTPSSATLAAQGLEGTAQESSSALVELPVAEAPIVREVAAAPRPQPAPRAEPVVVYRTPEPAPQPRVVTTTNVKRDAAIGAGAGAVIGAVVHRPNRWKGAVVGGVIGGAAGAVVGATIDKTTRVVYP
jgi:hypothetical protein